MRIWRIWFVIAMAFVLLSGCRTNQTQPAHSKSSGGIRSTAPFSDKPVVVPAVDLNGKIARVNNAGKFVVIVFPVGQLPRMEQRLNVYRSGLKVAELKVTGPQLDDSVVADIVAGDAQEGDSVRQ